MTDHQPPMVAIRGLDRDLWRQIRTEAVRRGITAGELTNEIFRAWLDRELTRLEERES